MGRSSEDIIDELQWNADSARRLGYDGEAELMDRAIAEIVRLRKLNDNLHDVLRGAAPLIEGDME